MVIQWWYGSRDGLFPSFCQSNLPHLPSPSFAFSLAPAGLVYDLLQLQSSVVFTAPIKAPCFAMPPPLRSSLLILLLSRADAPHYCPGPAPLALGPAFVALFSSSTAVVTVTLTVTRLVYTSPLPLNVRVVCRSLDFPDDRHGSYPQLGRACAPLRSQHIVPNRSPACLPACLPAVTLATSLSCFGSFPYTSRTLPKLPIFLNHHRKLMPVLMSRHYYLHRLPLPSQPQPPILSCLQSVEAR